MFFTPTIIKKIAKANLIGRGCNNFETAKKWQMVRDTRGKEKFVICNASESEPAVFKDKYILENWPERVMDGVEIAMKTIKASKGFLYLNPEYYQKFQTGLNELIKKRGANIELYQKPLHDYVGGEETAVINSMQGLRVEPRLKPPFPTVSGFYNAPTLVNNCETLYAVSLINSGEYKNTRFYCLSGDDIKKEIMELPTDIKVREALKEFDHTPSDKYFYQVGGGASGNVYNWKQLNRVFNGLASIKIYNINKPEKEIVMNWLNFFVEESCGQCVPCREGTYRLRNMMEEYYNIRKNSQLGKRDDSHKFAFKVFDDLIFSLQNTSFCPLGRISANAMLSYYKNILKKDI